MMFDDNGAGNTIGYSTTSTTSIGLKKVTGTFSVATDTTYLYGQTTFGVS
jgi:hypothetical protein